jgi:D-alanyl-D-alanine carboxypeptidase/D-alanyl-D-alanine-endopeptidase (penicillin-binding protein 4)
MTREPTRRAILGGLASLAGTAAIGAAPDASPRPQARGVPLPALPKVSVSERLVRAAKLTGDVGFAVTDAATGEVLESRLGETALPPASTLKTVTSLYALEKLGPAHRFATEVLATGPVRNGKLTGDLILSGSGDPTLDTDRLADLAVLLREAGIHEVDGRFLLWADAVPRGDRIDTDQPEHVGYNPAYGGLNLNFNRIHFEWKRAQDDRYDVTMEARAQRFSPSTSVASMSIVDRKTPVFDHWTNGHADNWSVARFALGNSGARWLPVRYPALYTGDVFRTLARSNGILLTPPAATPIAPEGATVLARVESEPLVPVLRDMLKYSTNLTAEMVGLTASRRTGPVTDLMHSARRMSAFALLAGTERAVFRDHSGLGYGSALSPVDMVRLLGANLTLAPLLKTVDLSLDKARPSPKGVTVRAKTGTLNFVSSLAGFVDTGGRKLAFAFLSADTARRDAIPPEQRENPAGAKGWAGQSRRLQKELLRNWAEVFA